MDDWLDPAPPHTAKMCDILRKSDFNLFCAMVSEQAEANESPKGAFAELYAFVACLWHGMRDEQPLVRPLVKLFYDLENGVGELLPVERKLSLAENHQRAALLDLGRARFKALLIEAFPNLPGIGVRNVVIQWARLQYEHVHCFQAPPRLNREQAVRDSMGLSDHFAELMTEVLGEGHV
jgi:hypothetical protein